MLGMVQKLKEKKRIKNVICLKDRNLLGFFLFCFLGFFSIFKEMIPAVIIIIIIKGIYFAYRIIIKSFPNIFLRLQRTQKSF